MGHAVGPSGAVSAFDVPFDLGVWDPDIVTNAGCTLPITQLRAARPPLCELHRHPSAFLISMPMWCLVGVEQALCATCRHTPNDESWSSTLQQVFKPLRRQFSL